MTGKRQQKKEHTRQAILQAAIRLFGQRGYENTTIDTLASEAGVGKGTIYGYFRSKSDILLAFCNEEIDIVFTALTTNSPADASLADLLLMLFIEQFHFITQNPDFGRQLIREMVFPRQLTALRSKDMDDRYISQMRSVLLAAQDRGELRRDLNLLFATGHFYALYLMTLSAWYMGRLQDEDDVREALSMLIDQALKGLAPVEKAQK